MIFFLYKNLFRENSIYLNILFYKSVLNFFRHLILKGYKIQFCFFLFFINNYKFKQKLISYKCYIKKNITSYLIYVEI